MSLNLHDNCLKELKLKLKASIEAIRLNKNSVLDYESIVKLSELDKTLPENKKKVLLSYISEDPFSDFIIEKLSKELLIELENIYNKKIEKLISLPQFSNSEIVADRLIEEFNTLPWQYNLSFKISNEIAQYIEEEEIEIATNIRLVRTSSKTLEMFPLKTGNPKEDDNLSDGFNDLLYSRSWEPDSVYLQIKAEGFISKWLSSTPKENAINIYKSFLGLLIALRVIEVNKSNLTDKGIRCCRIHRESNGWKFENSFNLDDEVNSTLFNLRMDDLNGKLETKSDYTRVLKNGLEIVSKVFLLGTISEKIILAGCWLFDSYCDKNELMSFIKTTVALELLLGDKKDSEFMGLGALLRNRCAYLISKNQKQRDEVLADFQKIYDIRSNIVHSGKSKLSQNDKLLFNRLQFFTNRVIQEEIKLITND